MALEEWTLPDPTKVTAFLGELTAVCPRHGIGLSGAPVLFLLEHDDCDRVWRELPDGAVEFT